MPLPSFLKRQKVPAGPPRGAEDGPAVEIARTRARRRLIGAVVLLGLGIVIFPIIFETTPRPVSPAVPIEVPKAERAEREVVLPAPVRATAPVPKSKAPPPVVAEAAVDVPPPAAVAASTAPATSPRPTAAVAAASRPAPVAASSPPPSPKPDDAQRAQALLEGSAGDTQATARFVVQVGAYSDPNTLREARQKVEKLGLKTYTQVVDTDAGKRTRVRVGPFATREEADSAGAKLKSAGLPAAVLTL